MADTPLIDIENLRVTFNTRSGPHEALRGVSLRMGREKVGVVGESGSGKSLTGKSILGLVPSHARVTADRLAFDGQDLMTMPPRALRRIRGRRIGLVMQDPKYCLNPVLSVGKQLVESGVAGGLPSRRAAYQRAVETLASVQIKHRRGVVVFRDHRHIGIGIRLETPGEVLDVFLLEFPVATVGESTDFATLPEPLQLMHWDIEEISGFFETQILFRHRRSTPDR